MKQKHRRNHDSKSNYESHVAHKGNRPRREWAAMDIAIYGFVSLVTISGIVFAATFVTHKSIAAWSLFVLITASAFAFTLNWQKSIWEEAQGASTSPPPALPRQSKNSSGLAFREVSPQQLGVELPRTFEVDFGTIRTIFNRKILESQVPFERISAVTFSGKIPIGIVFDKDGQLKVDATVYGSDGTIGAVVKKSDFSVLSAKWDRNWDATAFEIVDEHGIPFFQIERHKENTIKIRGIFRTSKDELLVSTDAGLIYNPTRPVAAPVALFRYPSNNHFHVRKASTSN